ncbi:phage major tail tube protein [Xylella fastidiosa]|uniref:phage major tail tube protein n=1 Tax=Xylella fastidiosa TaxID=2371 RepID=UPI0035D498E2
MTLKTEEFFGVAACWPLWNTTMGVEKLEDRCRLDLLRQQRAPSVRRHRRGACELRRAWLSGILQWGTTTSLWCRLRGKVREIDRGTWKSQHKSGLEPTLALSYYKEVHNATVIHEIDVENMIFQQNGIDLLAPARNALGL